MFDKIPNKKLSPTKNISVLSNKHLSNYEELIAAKLITIKKNIDDNIKLCMNETIAEILISNLITNAIKHNINNGIINITLTKKYFSISNTGIPLKSDPSELFERFKKDTVSSESLGLGLSIVKKICERYGYGINYNYSDPMHTTTITF